MSIQKSNPQTRNIIICDLIPASDISVCENHHTFFSQTSFASLSTYLVASNVARYIDRQTNDQSSTLSDDEKENLYIANNR